MSHLKTIWGLLFRLFPCPTPAGLRRIGNPASDSPVLVTCNFHLTVKRLERCLRGLDAWLLVCDSKGVNVWCASGAEELNTHSVVSAVKTSEVSTLVDHRRLILPPLSAPGVRAAEVQKQTGWTVQWGPVRAEDLPRYLAGGGHRDEAMKRVTYNWRERLDAALGSLFPFYLLGAGIFLLVWRHLLLHYLVIAAATFFAFFLACPRIPGKRGLTKTVIPEVFLGGILVTSWLWLPASHWPVQSDVIIAMVMVLIYGVELGGLAPHMTSELDPALARLGVGAIGNARFAGTIRTELLIGNRVLVYDPPTCKGCRSCLEVCPVGVWDFEPSAEQAVLAREQACTACRACLVQCGSGAIQAPRRNSM
jgi:NAD-dependent dihydropyrimidine dehydrogenase PreA subunit